MADQQVAFQEMLGRAVKNGIVDTDTQDALMDFAKSDGDFTKAEFHVSGGQAPTYLQVYRCKIKSRRQINKEIPREHQGWWADVSAGQILNLRQAVQADLDRCNLSAPRSRNPDDYMCETFERGSLVSKVALEYMNPEQHVFALVSAHPLAEPALVPLKDAQGDPMIDRALRGNLGIAELRALIREVEAHHGINGQPQAQQGGCEVREALKRMLAVFKAATKDRVYTADVAGLLAADIQTLTEFATKEQRS